MSKKYKVIIACVVILLLLAAGGWYILKNFGNSEEGTEVYMQKVSMLTGDFGLISDRYSGVVESQQTIDFKRSGDREINEIYVKEGDVVTKGTALFKYDVSKAETDIANANLDIEGLNNDISVLQSSGGGIDAELQISQKQIEIRQIQEQINRWQLELNDAVVTSTIDGVIKSVSDGTQTDSMGNEKPIVVVMETGDFRVKGKISEQSISMITTGQPVIVRSRIDESQIWRGTISKIEAEPVAEQDKMMDMYEDMEGSGSSSYPFYITLESTEGLMLGQHVFIEMDFGQGEIKEGIWIDQGFVLENEDGTHYVWSENNGKLIKKDVEIGEFDEEMWTVEIVSGLSKDDLIAWPDETLEEGMDTINILEME